MFFNHVEIKRVEEHLSKRFLEVRQRFNVLAEKSLISINSGSFLEMHSLLEQLGVDIVRKQSIHNPGKRRFLVDKKEICELLTDDAAGSRSVIGINVYFNGIQNKLNISERAFESMSNLQFLRVHGDRERVNLPRGLNYISRKLQLLEWRHFPMTCLPSIVNVELLVELILSHSNLEKLWEGIKPLQNLKWINLSYSKNLKELPDLSTATNLEELDTSDCSSLVKLPSTIGYATNLQRLNLCNCSSLIKLPSSIENATKLEKLYLGGCSSLVELPATIGNLEDLDLSNCASLVELPSTATNLEDLDLSNCSSLVELPCSIGSLKKLQKLRLGGCSKLEVIPNNINLESLEELDLTDCTMLKSFPKIQEVPHSIRSWSCLDEVPHGFDIQEVPPLLERISRLDKLWLRGCRNLVSIPQIPDSLSYLDVEGCESLERLDCSFQNPNMYLNFSKCSKLNQEARDLIIERRNCRYAVVPGREVPSYFTHRATSGDSLTVKLTERPLPTSMKFQACILLVNRGEDEKHLPSFLSVTCRKRMHHLHPVLREHLYIVEVETEVTSSELLFEFMVNHKDWKIGECGLLQLS